MKETENDFLKRFYCLLRDNLQREKSLKANSILISFLESRSASRFKLLSNSTISSSIVPNDILMSLLAKKEIQAFGDLGKYAITAKGVWNCEQSAGIMNEETLLSYMNEKFFIGDYPSSDTGADLDEKEAVILLTMIAARAFSEKSPVDLKKSDIVKGKWQEILERSYDLLLKLDMITKLNKEEFLGEKGNEHVVTYVFRHNNHSLQKTRGIYAYKGNYEYYLKIAEDSGISVENLSYLFWKIFKGDISLDSVNMILGFCNEISRKESIYLFDMKDHAFSMPLYDALLKDSLLDSVVSKSKWSRSS